MGVASQATIAGASQGVNRLSENFVTAAGG
jgi:hypothetical protein